MKKILKQISTTTFCMVPAAALFFCSWQQPASETYSSRVILYVNQKDTVPKESNDVDINMQPLDKTMKDLDINMKKINEQMKNIKIDVDKNIATSLSNIDFEAMQKQIETSMKAIDWNKIQQDVNVSMQHAQEEMAKIDFTKVEKQMKDLQQQFQSEEFKSQFNTEKMQKQINEGMQKAKEGMEKAELELKKMKDFTDELAADGLIDKKKGFTIQWKNGDLYINDKQQPKDISNKYRKYENKNGGKIQMQPEGAEHF
jgi:hypothetical protein